MPETVHCETHGESKRAFICIHLMEDSSGLGFNREEPTEGDAYPDAWCDKCELVRTRHGGWDDVPDDLCKIVVVCCECYERSRVRNTHTSLTLADLDGLRWKCGSCDEWHSGPLLDLSFDAPASWPKGHPAGSRWDVLPSGAIYKGSTSFLDDDYCVVNNEHSFVRGLIHLPIVGTCEAFCWGVWGSLSAANFETLLRLEDDPRQATLPPMFSWLNSNIAEYPNTLTLKMKARIEARGLRPHFDLERSDHPLSREFYEGITPERVKEIMFRSLPPQATT